MSRLLPLGAVATLSLVLSGCGGPAVPPQQGYGTVRGRVYDVATNNAVAGATISVGIVLTTTSGSDGTYRIATVPPGPYVLDVRPPAGYTQSPPIPDALSHGSLQAGETAVVDVPLTKSP